MIGSFSSPSNNVGNRQSQPFSNSQTKYLNSQSQYQPSPPQQSGFLQEYVECNEHPGDWITNFCSCVECLRPLCPECVTFHNSWHKQQRTYAEIETIKGIKQRCEIKVLNATNLLEQQIQNGENTLLSTVDSLEEGLRSLRQCRQRIEEVIDGHFFALEEQLTLNAKDIRNRAQQFQPTFQKMKGAIGELNELLQNLEGRGNVLDAIQKICQIDIQSILSRFKSELNRAATSLAPEKFLPRLDETRLFFLSEELERTVFLRGDDQIQQKQRIQIDSRDSISQNLQQQQYSEPLEVNVGNWFDRKAERKFLHFFQNDENKLHYIDLKSVEEGQAQFTTVELQIPFKIPSFHKSIATPQGDLYLTGGTIPDGSMTKSGNIYLYDWNAKSLVLQGSMLHPRSSHGIGYIGGKIYVVGGYEEKHILSGRCERYSLLTRKWERVASLNNPCASLSLCGFKDRYLYKFGGIGDSLDQDGLLSPYIERYDQNNDIWETIDPKLSQSSVLDINGRSFGLLSTSASVQISNNQIFIFGGYHEDNQGSNQTFVLKIDNEQEEVSYSEQQLSSNSKNTNKRQKQFDNKYFLTHINSKRLPHCEAFWSNVPIVHNKKIYALQNIAGESSDNCLEFERRILIFDQFKWYSL